MTDDIQTLARRLRKALAGGGDADEALADIARLHGPDIAVAVIEEVKRQVDFDEQEATAAYETETRFNDEMLRLFRACPEAKTSHEVCRIMAGRGDAFAAETLAWLEGRDYRLDAALDEAAAELHPGWRLNDDGSLTKLDASAPEPGSGLQEWLYKHFPRRAAEIERSIK
jgi:hypothetical protein